MFIGLIRNEVCFQVHVNAAKIQKISGMYTWRSFRSAGVYCFLTLLPARCPSIGLCKCNWPCPPVAWLLPEARSASVALAAGRPCPASMACRAIGSAPAGQASVSQSFGCCLGLCHQSAWASRPTRPCLIAGGRGRRRGVPYCGPRPEKAPWRGWRRQPWANQNSLLTLNSSLIFAYLARKL